MRHGSPPLLEPFVPDLPEAEAGAIEKPGTS
jgi:hypothetical protein